MDRKRLKLRLLGGSKKSKELYSGSSSSSLSAARSKSNPPTPRLSPKRTLSPTPSQIDRFDSHIAEQCRLLGNTPYSLSNSLRRPQRDIRQQPHIDLAPGILPNKAQRDQQKLEAKRYNRGLPQNFEDESGHSRPHEAKPTIYRIPSPCGRPKFTSDQIFNDDEEGIETVRPYFSPEQGRRNRLTDLGETQNMFFEEFKLMEDIYKDNGRYPSRYPLGRGSPMPFVAPLSMKVEGARRSNKLPEFEIPVRHKHRAAPIRGTGSIEKNKMMDTMALSQISGRQENEGVDRLRMRVTWMKKFVISRPRIRRWYGVHFRMDKEERELDIPEDEGPDMLVCTTFPR